MFGMQILDVAIGLIFIFLLLSLVVTAANELIASWLKRRSATLWSGVVQLLGSEEDAGRVYSHPLVAGITQQGWFRKYRGRLPFKKRPSYIPSRVFALALIDTLAPAPAGDSLDKVRAVLAARLKAGPDDRLARSLSVLLEDARGEIEGFRRNIEGWFDTSMERVSGWYKRRTQWILLATAAAVTVWSNADAIQIANVLWRDSVLRPALAAQAEQFAAQGAGETAPDVGLRQSMARVQSLAIPLGWRDPSRPGDPREPAPGNLKEWGAALGAHLLGWLLTTLAVSLGAPFWFDMLNKVVTIRAAGKSPVERKAGKGPEGTVRHSE